HGAQGNQPADVSHVALDEAINVLRWCCQRADDSWTARREASRSWLARPVKRADCEFPAASAARLVAAAVATAPCSRWTWSSWPAAIHRRAASSRSSAADAAGESYPLACSALAEARIAARSPGTGSHCRRAQFGAAA